MKHYFTLSVALSLTLLSRGQDQKLLLAQAYQSNSLAKLRVFFENWTKETPALSSPDIDKLNDTARNVYLVFKAFYDPLQLGKTGGSEWGNNIYKQAKYFLLQDKVLFAVVDTLDEDVNKKDRFEWPQPLKYDTIEHFRPQVSFKFPKTVTLTENYDLLLNGFLGDDHSKLGAGNIMSPAASKGESKVRKEFLEKCIKIWYGHWGGYWQLLSYPSATSVIFDKAFKTAVINYRLVYEGGYAYLRRVDGVWTLIEAQRTWIE
jgi:hypothetical protein